MRSHILIALFGFMAGTALFLLLKEHQAHVVDVLPWALLLLCPVLHLFMHRGHGKHGSTGGMEMREAKEVSPGSHDMGKGQGKGE